MTPEQRAMINEALAQYDAVLTDGNHKDRIMRVKAEKLGNTGLYANQLMGVKVVVAKGRIKYLLPSGTVAATSPITAKDVEKFVEGFWLWKANK